MPDEVINGLVFDRLNALDSYVLDGYPRTVEQAELLGEGVDVVILIDVDEDTCVQRISKRSEGRKDDNEETARKRYEMYESLTVPILEFYKGNGRLRTIDGALTPELVFRKILEVLGDAE